VIQYCCDNKESAFTERRQAFGSATNVIGLMKSIFFKNENTIFTVESQ
jgi:hypothetical protein